MEKKKHFHLTKAQLVAGALFLIVIMGIIITTLYFVRPKQPSVIPPAIKKHVAFQTYVPDTTSQQWNIPADSISYDSSQGVLSITALSSSNKLYITEQNTPDPFNDIPQYYPTLLGKLNEYSEIQTSIGMVALTRPAELKGGQSAVSNTHGTLMFVRPQNDLSDSEWKNFFNSLDVNK